MHSLRQWMVIMKRLWFMLVFLCCIALPLFPGGERESGGESASGRTNGNADLFSEEYANPIIKNETDDRLVVFDADGNEVTLTKRPDRAIINYTSMLGLWYLAGGRAVGRPDTRGLKGVPEGAWDIETTGHVANPNLEKIISLEPDFVVLSGTMDIQRRIKEVLDQYEVENILLNYEHYHDFLNILDLFVRIVDEDGVVESLVPGIQTEVGRIIDSCRGFDPPRFLSLFASTRDVLVELNDSHTARIAAMLGGENIAGAVTPRRGQKRINLSMERIVQAQPEVILVTVMGDMTEIQDKMKEDLAVDQAWKGLDAVREGRVHYLPNDLFLYKPNERFPEAFTYIAELLYPDIKDE